MEKIIVAGFGGQGVLSLGQLLTYAAMYENQYATWLPSYGPEMRGGTANCSVVIDAVKPVASPIIAVADTLIAMNKPSLDKFQLNVRKDGLIIINSSLINDKCANTEARAVYVDANRIAHENGNNKASNLVILGAYIKHSGLFPKEVILSTIEKVYANKPQFIPSNKACFEAGYEL